MHQNRTVSQALTTLRLLPNSEPGGHGIRVLSRFPIVGLPTPRFWSASSACPRDHAGGRGTTYPERSVGRWICSVLSAGTFLDSTDVLGNATSRDHARSPPSTSSDFLPEGDSAILPAPAEALRPPASTSPIGRKVECPLIAIPNFRVSYGRNFPCSGRPCGIVMGRF